MILKIRINDINNSNYWYSLMSINTSRQFRIKRHPIHLQHKIYTVKIPELFPVLQVYIVHAERIPAWLRCTHSMARRDCLMVFHHYMVVFCYYMVVFRYYMVVFCYYMVVFRYYMVFHYYIFTLPVFSATINMRKILTFNFPWSDMRRCNDE